MAAKILHNDISAANIGRAAFSQAHRNFMQKSLDKHPVFMQNMLYDKTYGQDKRNRMQKKGILFMACAFADRQGVSYGDGIESGAFADRQGVSDGDGA